MRSASVVVNICAAALLLAAPPSTWAQARNAVDGGEPAVAASRAPTRVMRGTRTDQAPVIDGRLDDAVWAAAEVVGDFVKARPSPGEPASERTEARVLYDAEAVYVAMRMYESDPSRIAAQLGRRDQPNSNSDYAHVLFDSYHDRRTAFHFLVNPRNVQADLLHYDDFAEDVNWDAVWTSGVAIDSLGWTAEFRIPLSQLRFSDRDGEMVWGINFARDIARHGELSTWSPVLPTVAGIVSQSGELHGLTGLEAPRRLEVLPYTVSRLTRAPLELDNPFYDRNSGGLEIGADVRYGLTSNLTVSATINPDFGQVEADPSVVNLSGFETFFPEKRPFFVEGSNIFSFGIGTDDRSGEGLFYSRRIGRAPQRSVDEDDGWVEAPEATTILGAAKVSGKTANGWTIGLLDAVTNREVAAVATAAGERREEVVEPLTNYLVGSLSRDFRRGESAIGLLGTATHRRLGDGDDFRSLRDAAYAAGLRGRHRFLGGAWEANGYLAASHVRGDTAAISKLQRGAGHYFQRPDADHIEFDPTRTSLTGAAATLIVGKIGGSKLRGGVGSHLRTPGLEVNDIGFMAEADQFQLFGNLRYEQFEPQGPFRNWNIGLNPFSMWTTGGERMVTQLGNWANFELKNLWSGGWWTGRRFEAISNASLRGGPAIIRPGGQSVSTWLNTDRRRPVWFELNAFGGYEEGSGSWEYGASPGVNFRPTTQLNLSLFPDFRRVRNTWQYVDQPEAGGQRHYLVGTLDQRTLSLTARLNYTIRPTLSFELYAQPFVSAGDYTDFRTVTNPRADRFDDRFLGFGPGQLSYDPEKDEYRALRPGTPAAGAIVFDDPNFNKKEFRSNAVVRWEYRPGSTLFVVWSQGRSDSAVDGSFDTRRDFGRLFGLEPDFSVQPTNVLLIKLNYWLNM